MPLLKVWSVNRRVKKLVFAKSLLELKEKGKYIVVVKVSIILRLNKCNIWAECSKFIKDLRPLFWIIHLLAVSVQLSRMIFCFYRHWKGGCIPSVKSGWHLCGAWGRWYLGRRRWNIDGNQRNLTTSWTWGSVGTSYRASYNFSTGNLNMLFHHFWYDFKVH